MNTTSDIAGPTAGDVFKVSAMQYETPESRVTDLKLDTDFLASGKDNLSNNGIEPVEYEEF